MSGAWRYEWAAAVRKCADLNATARLVANVLALDFANSDTGQCNPSQDTLADHLGVSVDTIKRALRDLKAAGFLATRPGRWRGATASYEFLSPGKVVAMTPGTAPNRRDGKAATGADHARKGGQACTPNRQGKGCKSARKGVQICTDHIRKEPCKNILARPSDACPVGRLVIVPDAGNGADAWASWLRKGGWPTLDQIGIRSGAETGAGWVLPAPTPPADGDDLGRSIAQRYLDWVVGRMTDARTRVA